MRKTSSILPVLFCVTALAAAARGQTASADTDVARHGMLEALTGQSFAPEPGFAPASPFDQDLGEQRLLVPRSRDKSFTLTANVTEFHTSNAARANGGAQGDWFTAMQFGAMWLPRITGSLYGETTGIQQQMLSQGKLGQPSPNPAQAPNNPATIGAGALSNQSLQRNTMPPPAPASQPPPPPQPDPPYSSPGGSGSSGG